MTQKEQKNDFQKPKCHFFPHRNHFVGVELSPVKSNVYPGL